MLKNYCKNNWQILAYNILLLAVFIIFYGRFGDIIVDSFREAYIPEQIVKGKVLYKQIFSIYAPFAYLFNALLFAIFGAKLKVLYFAGFFATAAILNLVYKISQKFLDNKTYSMGIILFLISVCVLSNNVFNYIFPYSYGILYGLLFILLSIYFALKKDFFLAYLAYSFAVCSKYEFIFLLPLLIWMSGKDKIFKNLCGLFIPFFITSIPFVIKGLTISDIIISAKLVLAMSSAKTLYWFYSISGLVFRPQLILIYLISLLKVFIPLLLMYYFQNRWVKIAVLIYLFFAADQEILIYALPLILALTFIRFRELNKEEKFMAFASVLVSAKVFFAAVLESYGVFFIPLIILALFVVIPKKYIKTMFTFVILCSLVFGVKNSTSLLSKNTKIETQKGVVYGTPEYGNSVKELTEYISKKTGKNDKVIVYPECLALNFLSGRETDNKFYSILPLYAETFGENLIIQRLEYKKPEYIVVSNYDTSNYYYSFFGKDYAKKVYVYILENYQKEATIGEPLVFTVFKRKN